MRYPVTPDGRYFMVWGRLWRCSNPKLTTERRAELTRELMNARRDKGRAMRDGDEEGRERARQRVEEAKQALGERGAVWWTDGAPDWNRHMGAEYALCGVVSPGSVNASAHGVKMPGRLHRLN